MSTVSNNPNLRRFPWWLAVLVTSGLVWAYWPTWHALQERWTADSLYSHGFLVPFVSAGMLWWRRAEIQKVGTRLREGAPQAAISRIDCAAGIGLIGLGIGLRLAAAKFYFEWFDGLSLVPTVAGLVFLAGGLPMWRAVWPAVVYLLFLVPLPFRLENVLGGPLQSIASSASTFGLQTLGFPATTEGQVIVINQSRIGVAEACSGLRMLMVFFAVTAVVAMCSRKPLWERGVVLSSAVPIAVIANVIRITVTGVLFETVGSAAAKLVLHDLAGWLMMLLAVALLQIELWALSHLLIDPPKRAVIPVERTDRFGRKAERARPAVSKNSAEPVTV